MTPEPVPPEVEPPATPAGRLAAAALGVFVAWQFLFLPAANLFDRLPPEETPPPVRGPRAAVERWGEFTGHFQSWPLFAGELIPVPTFVAVEFTFPSGETAEVRSRFEPAGPGGSARLAGVANRVFNQEVRIGLVAAHMTPDRVASDPDGWRRLVVEDARVMNPSFRAFMAARWREYRADHPDAPEPVEYRLVARQYPHPGTSEPTVRPFARWVPGRPVEPGQLPVEVFDPVENRFVRVPAGGGGP